MDIATIATSVVSSLGVSAAGAWWLSKALVSHRLAKDLENYKSKWQRELEREKLEIAGRVKERVDSLLGDRAAEREYALEAKKRLYQLIGPLKFQLLIACRDAAHRIEGHGLKAAYDMSVGGYYGVNTIHRILRPLAISELIEQQVAYADFAVDESAIGLLRFKKSATLAFTGGDVMRDHPNVDWNQQSEHLFYATLSEAAHALIATDANGAKRVIEYHEFATLFASNHNNQGLSTLARIIDQFTMKSKPLFWVRLVAFGHNCREYVGTAGAGLDFEYRRYNLRALLERSEDEYILANLDAFKTAVESSILQKL
jgi:hypothetical protein